MSIFHIPFFIFHFSFFALSKGLTAKRFQMKWKMIENSAVPASPDNPSYPTYPSRQTHKLYLGPLRTAALPTRLDASR